MSQPCRTKGGLREKLFFKKNIPGYPLVTVITVVFNGDKYLEATILSIINQSYDNIEYIVIDGGSTDKTLDIIDKYDHSIDCWVSEPDKGIYDAMNKGIKLANGQYLIFLGADDIFYGSNVIEEIIKRTKGEDYGMIFGKIQYNDGNIVKSVLSRKTLIHNTVHHQSCLYSKYLFQKWTYDSSLRLIADYELNLISYLRGIKYFSTDLIVSICRKDGASQNVHMYNVFMAETNIIRARHLNYFLNLLFWFIFNVKAIIYRFNFTIVNSMSYFR